MLEIKRPFQIGDKVKVYKNIHKDCYSIVDHKSGLVVGYADYVCLKDAKTHINQNGRKRVVDRKRKEVHAYLVGTFAGCQFAIAEQDTPYQLYYNPYKTEHFVNKQTKEAVHTARLVRLEPQQVKYL